MNRPVLPVEKWTPEEDNIVKTVYQKEGVKATHKLLPRRTRPTKPWTNEELDILKTYYSKISLGEIHDHE